MAALIETGTGIRTDALEEGERRGTNAGGASHIHAAGGAQNISLQGMKLMYIDQVLHAVMQHNCEGHFNARFRYMCML